MRGFKTRVNEGVQGRSGDTQANIQDLDVINIESLLAVINLLVLTLFFCAINKSELRAPSAVLHHEKAKVSNNDRKIGPRFDNQINRHRPD